MKQIKLMQGDNMKSLDLLPDNSIDSIVTDPPYGLSFMNKKWDYEVPSVEFWKKVYQKLKPGGHVLSFGGTRTYHRMVVNMEDAGFEIRDQIMWIYGSGFPKSLNIGKSYDKKVGNEREVVGTNPCERKNIPERPIDGYNSLSGKEVNITKGSSQYEGWGTALKPANEPICLARKPLSEKTIVDNVIKWGTGGINVDGCRVDTNGEKISVGFKDDKGNAFIDSNKELLEDRNYESPEGRFPANILFDETAAEMLDEQSGISQSKKRINPSTKKEGSLFSEVGFTNTGAGEYNDKGGASRFFYVAKVSKKERNLGLDDFEDKENKEVYGKGLNTATKLVTDKQKEDGVANRELVKNNHPTLKPINLMTYLCRLITPPGGIVLDPFMGSGSTGISACLEGFRFVGMELDEDYFKIAEARVNSFEEYRKLLK